MVHPFQVLMDTESRFQCKFFCGKSFAADGKCRDNHQRICDFNPDVLNRVAPNVPITLPASELFTFNICSKTYKNKVWFNKHLSICEKSKLQSSDTFGFDFTDYFFSDSIHEPIASDHDCDFSSSHN